MNIQQNISLKPYNTFGIECEARYFVSVHTIEELQEALALPKYLKNSYSAAEATCYLQALLTRW